MDLASCAFPTFSPDALVTKTVNPVGAVNPGDVLTYTITVQNTGDVVLTNTTLTDAIPSGTSYVANSTTLNGNSVSDNAGQMPYEGGGYVNSSGNASGSVINGSSAVVTFQVITDCCPGTATISNQGTVNYDGAVAPELTDDPTLPGATDPTVNNISTLAAPMLMTPASNLSLACNVATNTTAINNWLSSNGGASASVACGNITWTNDYSGISDLCGATGTVLVTFTATNDCGDASTTSATITVTDNTDPVWDTLPSDITLECDGTTDPGGAIAAWLASNGTTGSASDACGAVTYTNDYTGLSDLCGATGTATVTFTATAACGNFATSTASVTVEDNTAPVWTADPSDITLECDGTSDPGGAIAAWLASFGTTGAATDACGAVTITDDYVALTTTGCSGTGNAIVTFTATDECGLTTERFATLTIVDTTAPSISSLPDITVDCDDIPAPVDPTILDDCDPTLNIVYEEVAVYHPDANWKSSTGCTILYTISNPSYDDKGTVSTGDDEMSFQLTVIGQNIGTGWSATVNGIPINGEYYKTYQIGSVLSGGSNLNFQIIDNADAGCISLVTLNAVDF